MVAPDPKQELFVALSHPLRHRILAMLLRSGSEPLSPSQIAESLGEPVTNTSYHVRVLKGLGVIKLVETRPVRGSVEHLYRIADAVGEVPWSRRTLEEMVVPEPLPPLDTLLDRETFERDAPETLSEREREIVAMHYGFGLPEKLPRRLIAERLGLTEAQVRTAERQALRKLERVRRRREGS